MVLHGQNIYNFQGEKMEEKIKQMRERTNDLSDIVLERDSKKTENTKKWLLTAASMILLFLIILIIMKMLNKPDESTTQENIAQVGESIETLTDETSADASSAIEENLFKKEPIIDETSETDLKFEEMVRKLKEQDKVEEPPAETVAEVKEEKMPEVAKEQEVKPKEIKPVVEVVKQPEPTVSPAIVTKPAPKKVVAPAPREVFSHATETRIPSISGYFIQVGATAKSFPDKRFLTKIKRAGFDYIVHGVNIKGKQIKKVLVGPYSSRAAAKNALASVKANINPSAYIYRIK